MFSKLLSHYTSVLVQPQPLVFRGDADCLKSSTLQEQFKCSQQINRCRGRYEKVMFKLYGILLFSNM